MFKYLGFLITPSGEIVSGLKDLRDRALKAFMKLKEDLGISFRQNCITTLSLVDFLIRPILLYASDFWGCMKLPKSNPIENLHMLMCKQILGVQRQTTNIGVLLELGRVPLEIFGCKFSIRNWERIRNGNSNYILSASYRDAMNNSLPWIESIKTILERNGMLNLYLNDGSNQTSPIYQKVFQRLSDIFHQNSFELIRKEESKLRFYAIFKKNIGLEKYLLEIMNPSVRTYVTKFRLSNHRLMIEVGRHQNTPKENRFCPFCPGEIENEMHMLFECNVYKYLRTKFIQQVIDMFLRALITYPTKEN